MNNNLSTSAEARCRCERYITLGEIAGGVKTSGYECPTCFHQKHSTPLTAEEFYEQIDRIFRGSNGKQEKIN